MLFIVETSPHCVAEHDTMPACMAPSERGRTCAYDFRTTPGWGSSISRQEGNGQMASGQNRQDVHMGARVRIVEKQNQRTGITTEGIVKDLLTSSAFHPHGIKVRLETGQVGRVKEIPS